MNTNKKNLWDKILKVLIAVLSAIAGALGANAMGILKREDGSTAPCAYSFSFFRPLVAALSAASRMLMA